MYLQAGLEEEEVDQFMALNRNRFEASDLREQETDDSRGVRIAWKIS